MFWGTRLISYHFVCMSATLAIVTDGFTINDSTNLSRRSNSQSFGLVSMSAMETESWITNISGKQGADESAGTEIVSPRGIPEVNLIDCFIVHFP